MIDATPPDVSGPRALSLDELLRDVLPQLKLALGELIDRENARALPGRYARLLPETLLAVTLRPDAADALAPVAEMVETELTDSCTLHGSLYDRGYRVQLRRVEDANAPLFVVSSHAGQSPPAAAAAPPSGPAAAPPRSTTPAPAAAPARPPAEPSTETALDTSTRRLPEVDPDATRLDGYGPASWEPGRWVLVVQDEHGRDQEVFRLTEPLTTVGRRSDDPGLRTTVALADVPQVSRRQLALVWQEQDGRPGFRVYNLGLPAVHLGGREIAGARVGKGPLRLEQVAEAHTAWLAPGETLKIGEHGPVLRLEEVPAPPAEDPEATRYE